MLKFGLSACGISAVTLAFSTPILAQAPAGSACSTTVEPTGEFAAWNKPSLLKAGTTLVDAPVLNIGSSGRISLASTPQVNYQLRPEKPGGTVSYGGILKLDIARRGAYRIALSSAAWIDLIGRDGPMRSTAHGHGPDCTGIRKVVQFDLDPGQYTLQIAANGAPEITILTLPS